VKDAHKEPERMCIGCRKKTSKHSLVRIVRSTDGIVLVDPSGKVRGRGAYFHTNDDCYEQAIRRKRLETALQTRIYEDDTDRLRREWTEYREYVRMNMNKDGESC